MPEGSVARGPPMNRTTRRRRGNERLIPWIYDIVVWSLGLLIDLYFREVHPRGAWKIPRSGPVIFVAAPHANQFVDSMILMRIFKMEANRRISWLIAEKSTKRKFVGAMSRAVGSIPVGRALDKVKKAEGRISLPDAEGDATLIEGQGVDFENGQFEVGGLIVLPKSGNQTPSAEIAKIESKTRIRLKKPFTSEVALKALKAEGGSSFQVAPFVDQGKVYTMVSDELDAGGVIGIFPEGGSHDRSDLLPLKAGVAIMALEALARNPNCGLKVIPIGMNYFHAHKFRSRAVIEFGHVIEVHPDQVEAYKAGDRRNAVGSLMSTVQDGLTAVTQSSPDYETLMLAQAARRLYNPHGKKLPLSLVVELNRRLVKGYTIYKDEPRVIEMKREVLQYNRELRALGVRDHQVEWGNTTKRPWWRVLSTLIYRLGELAVLAVGTLPGLAMFWPLFVVTKVISMKKSKEALAASTVKIKGRDVITTWKLMVALAVAPALYAYYTIIVSIWLVYNRRGGYYSDKVPYWMLARTYVPDWVPIWLFAIAFTILCISLTFAALRIGEIGMDVLKSLKPLIVALDPRSSSSLARLTEHRKELSAKVTDVINAFGPEVYPDFDANRIVADPFREGAYQSQYREIPETKVEGATEPTTPTAAELEDNTLYGRSLNFLPSNETFMNIGSFGFFSSRPHTPKSRSRSSSTGAGLGRGDGLKPFSSIDTQDLSQRIRGAMRERGKKRASNAGMSESSWDAVSEPDEEGVERKKER
ncbi:putative acyltransferase [Cyphellophora attinorum]|uniref:Putative acyltransferase n=1 Tax=Cyphellophora attinorum TaxID=1664694 RepID=A0A0N1HEW4_9EURO|nr:putative acyltransferase [Phialophora attinorum]KPI43517.1 putative acyltransferase [Phialophora attinorum]